MTLRGAAAEEAAELENLRRLSERRRQEVGETLAILMERVAESTDARVLARRAHQRSLKLARSASRAARRRPVRTAAVVGAAAVAMAVWWTARHGDATVPTPARAAPARARLWRRCGAEEAR